MEISPQQSTPVSGIQHSVTNPWSPAIPQSWMQDNLHIFGKYTLRQLCIPGSHDAGMSEINQTTAFAFPCNTQTQTSSIGGQLAAGVRYFDLRVVKSGGVFATGHYSHIGGLLNYQGATGQPFSTIMSDVANFLRTNNELVILDLSHDLDTDGSYEIFSQTQWNDLMQMLQQALGRYLWAAPAGQAFADIDLSSYPLSEFICPNGHPQPALVVLMNPELCGFSFGSYAGKGFYSSGYSLDYGTILATLGVPQNGDAKRALIQWFGSNCANPAAELSSLSEDQLIWSAQVFLYLTRVCGVPANKLTNQSLLAQQSQAIGLVSQKKSIRANLLATVPNSLGNNQQLMQYAYRNLHIYNSYADTGSTQTLEANQIGKMKVQRQQANDPCFLLSWTLTQDATQAALCHLNPTDRMDVLYLAGEANAGLRYIPQQCSRNVFPNIVFVDNVADSNVLNFVMEINFGVFIPSMKWTTHFQTGQTTTSGPALIYSSLASLNGYFCAFTANDSASAILLMQSPNGTSWGNSRSIGQTTKSGATPALAVFNNRLFCAFQAADNSNKLLITSSSDGIHWDLHATNTGQTTAGGIALEVFNNQLFCAFKSNDSSNKLLIMSSKDGYNWPQHAIATGQTTKTGPALKAYNNYLYCLFGSNDSSNNLIWMASADGMNWPVHAPLTLQSTGTQPALTIVQNQLWCAFKSNDSSNRYLLMAFANGYWTNHFPAAGNSTKSVPALCGVPGGSKANLVCMFTANNTSNGLLCIAGNEIG